MALEKDIEKKVIPIYEAVLSLISDGLDINTIKVSDVSSRAGIGKGTVYSYFKSKDEMIIKALFYSVNQKMMALSQILEPIDTFENTIMTVLDWMEDNRNFEATFVQILKITFNSYEIKSGLKCELMRHKECCKSPELILQHLVELARKEELANPAYSDKQILFAVTTQLAGYIIHGTHTAITSNEDMKKIVCENILKLIE